MVTGEVLSVGDTSTRGMSCWVSILYSGWEMESI